MPFLHRPHLDERIRAALRTGSVELHGSLGYGKTTVLRSALRGMNVPVARYDTAPWERDSFILPLIEAIGSVRPDFGRRARALAEAGAALATLGDALAADLAHVRAPIVIAIDDGGDVVDDGFRTFLHAFSHAAPDEVRIVVASRREAAEALRAPVARFNESDLRFSFQEIAKMLGTEDDSTVQRVLEATAGWPASVALTLAPETIPEVTRSALEPYAVQERIAAERVETFRSLGAFVEASDHYVTLQPIVRAQLLAAMRARADGSIERAHLAAAGEDEAAGRFSAALYHYEAAGSHEHARAFLHRNVTSLALHADVARIDELIRSSPLTNQADTTLATYVRALIEHRRGDARAGERFARAASLADAGNYAAIALLASLRSIEFELAHGQGLDSDAIGRVRARAEHAGNDATAAAAVLEGWSLATQGQFAATLSTLEPHDSPPTTREGSSIEILRAYAETSLGSIERAQQRMDGLIAALENSDRFVLHVQALIWYARLALLWGETAIALDYANEAYRRAEGFDAETESAALYAALAEASAHAGNADDALHWAREMRRHAETAWYEVDARRLSATSDQQTARALFARGDVAGARAIAEASADDVAAPAVARAALLADAAGYACVEGHPSASDSIAHAVAALESVRPLDAVDGVAIASAGALLDALAVARGGFSPARNGAILGPYSALARARDGSVRLPTVALALRNATRGDERPQALKNALELFTARGPRFEATLLSALARSLRVDATTAVRPALSEALTDREQQVLELLVEGLTNREIAARLILGTRTVETHVERILGKLGVASRTRAIAAALRLRMVVP